MALRESPFENFRIPPMVSAGVALVVALITAVILVGGGAGQAEARSHASTRAGFEGAAAPASGILALPVRVIGGFTRGIDDYFFAVRENRRLRAENARLEQELEQVTALRSLNARYEALLGMRIEPQMDTVGARTVSDARGPFSRARLIDAGTSRGVQVGNPVINEHGLVGRVSGASGGVSRMILLTDVSSQVPILVARSDARAILRGDGSDNPRIDFLRVQEAGLQEGDQILTSGDGGLLPRGIPIGVAARGLDGSWRVKLYSDRGAIDLVRVMLFEGFSRGVNPASLDAPPLTGLEPVPMPPRPAAPAPAAATPPATGGQTTPRPAATQPAPTPAVPPATTPQPTPGATG